MTDRSVVVRLRAEVDQFVAGMKKAQSEAATFGREMTGHGKTSRADLEQIGRGAAVMAAGLAAGFGLSIKAAMDWESAWAGVTKTVDGSAAEMAELEEGLRGLAKELPATHGEIAGVAEAAGQLGISRAHIVDFTETMIALGETTNLTADQAATSLARMSNIMQTPQADIEKMASTLVALGNAGASTESEILDMAMRIAGSAKQVGISEAATLGFANALSSVGIEAEAGGTAISRVFSTIATAVADGGAEMDEFARIAGMSGAEFRKAFQEDAAGATIAFIEGLDRIKGSGENVFAVLQNLELGDIRVRDALLRAAGAGDLFRESLALGADEWERNNALQTEAEKRYDTTAAKLEVARNQVVDLAINVGDVLLPAVAGVAGGLSTMVQGLDAMPGPLQAAGIGIGGLATGALGMIAAAGILLPRIQAIRAALISMGTAGRVASAAMPWLAAAGAAIATVSYIFGQNAKEAEQAEERVKGYTDAIREAGDATDGTKRQVEQLIADTPQLAAILDDAGVSADALGSALSGSDEDWAAMRDRLIETAEAAGLTGLAFESFEAGIDAQRTAALAGAEDAETLGRVLKDTGDAASGAKGGVDELTGGISASEEASKEAEAAFQDLMDAYRGAVDPLFGMLDALDGNREAQAALNEVLKDGDATAAEVDAAYRAVASSALDVEVAAATLNSEIANGNVTLEQASAMLGEWVQAGLITEAQAAQIATQFGRAADEGARIAPEYKTKVTADTLAAEEAIRRFLILQAMIRNSVVARIQVQLDNPYARVPGFQLGAAEGGLVPQYLAAGGMTIASGPRGTDTVPLWATPGEYMMQKSAVDRFGVGFMDAINAGMTPAGGGGSTYVFAPRIEVLATPGTDGRRVGQDIVDQLDAWTRSNGHLPPSITGA